MTWAPFTASLERLVAMARMPGFKAHAWHRAKELDADKTGLWTGIAAALAREMTGPEKTQESAPPNRGRRR